MPWTTNSTRRCIRAPVVAISQVRASSISRHRTATPRMASQRPRRMALMMATVCERVLGAGAYAHIGNKEGALPLVYIARRKKYLLAGMYRASCSPSATTRKRGRERLFTCGCDRLAGEIGDEYMAEAEIDEDSSGPSLPATHQLALLRVCSLMLNKMIIKGYACASARAFDLACPLLTLSPTHSLTRRSCE